MRSTSPTVVPFLKLFFMIPVLLLVLCTAAFGMPQGKGADHSGKTTVQTFNFVPPQILIDNVPISGSLMDAALKLACVEATIFHGAVEFDTHAPKVCPDIIEALIGRELLVIEAGKAGLTLDEKAFQVHLQDRYVRFGGKEPFSKVLSGFELTIGDYETLARHAYLARQYVERFLKPAPVTEKETKTYYNENISKFTKVEKRTTDFIVFTYQDNIPPAGAIEHLRDEILKVSGRDSLLKLESRHKQKFRGQVSTSFRYFDITYTPESGGIFWLDGFGKLSEGKAVYLNPESEKERHYVYLVRKIDPEIVTPYTEARSKISQRLIEIEGGNFIARKVQELKKQYNIRVVDAP